VNSHRKDCLCSQPSVTPTALRQQRYQRATSALRARYQRAPRQGLATAYKWIRSRLATERVFARKSQLLPLTYSKKGNPMPLPFCSLKRRGGQLERRRQLVCDGGRNGRRGHSRRRRHGHVLGKRQHHRGPDGTHRAAHERRSGRHPQVGVGPNSITSVDAAKTLVP